MVVCNNRNMKLIYHCGEELKVYIFIMFHSNKILVEQMISLESDNIQGRQLGDFNLVIVVMALEKEGGYEMTSYWTSDSLEWSCLNKVVIASLCKSCLPLQLLLINDIGNDTGSFFHGVPNLNILCILDLFTHSWILPNVLEHCIKWLSGSPYKH